MRVPRARHKLLALAVVGAVMVAAAAPSFGAAHHKSAPTEITFVDRVTSPTHDAFVKYLVDTFNQRNDGKIHVTYSGIPVNSYVAKIPLVLKSNKSPDVFSRTRPASRNTSRTRAGLLRSTSTGSSSAGRRSSRRRRATSQR